jgi:hemolysin activation/secretion protein
MPASAQDQPPVLPDPSQLESQFDEKKLPQSKIVIRSQITGQQPLAPEDDIQFTLKGLTISSATVFTEADFRQFYEENLGKNISVSRLFDIASRITAFYRNQGYILSSVTVPAQEITDGLATLIAVEGYIDQVSVEGDISSGEKLLTELGAKIAQSRPLKADDLERYILLANDIPGVNATAVLQASQTPGATDLAIVVSQDKARAFASINNRGARFSGPVQGQFGAEVNSIIGGASRTGVRVVGSAQTSEFKLFEFSHQNVLGTEGTTISLMGRRTLSRPGSALSDLDIESDSSSGRVSIQHPILRTRAKSFYVRAGFDIRDTKTEILGEDFSEDRIRVVRVGAAYDFVDRFDGVNLIDIEVSKGLDIFNATQTGDPFQSRLDAETGFLKVNGSVRRLQRIAPKISLLLDIDGQFTGDGLAASEELALGGSQFGRAFDPAEITGDRGVAGRAELRYAGTLRNKYVEQYQVYVFGDYGIVWNRVNNAYRSVDLGSVGAGLRFSLTEHVSVYAELATAIEKTPDYAERWGDTLRGFAGISLNF